MDGAYVNDPHTISLNDNQISINSTIEVDLFGQCCSESIGHVQFSGTGGQADTAIGAQKSKNGRSVIALYSTAMVKDKATGERVETSKIVPLLKQGAAVSLSRNDLSVNGSIFKETTNGDFLNYLSNVADFYYLTTTDGNNFKIDNYSDGSSVKNLPYVSFGTSKLDEINVISGNTTIGQEVSIYLLFDYNKNNINRLWTDNVGTNVDRIFFKEDLEFRVR
jgi:hypothetical protein